MPDPGSAVSLSAVCRIRRPLLTGSWSALVILLGFAAPHLARPASAASGPHRPVFSARILKDGSYTFPTTAVGDTSSLCTAVCFCTNPSACNCDRSGTVNLNHDLSSPFSAHDYNLQPVGALAGCFSGSPVALPAFVPAGQQLVYSVDFSPTRTGSFSDYLDLSGYIFSVSGATPRGSASIVPYQPSGWSAPVVVTNTAGTYIDTPLLRSADQLYVSWAVANGGDLTSFGTFYIDLKLDGASFQSWRWDNPLAPHDFIFVNDYPFGPLAPGIHTLELVPDSTNSIGSSSRFTKTFTVASASAPIRLSYRPGPGDGITTSYSNDGSDHFSPGTILTVGGNNDTHWALMRFDLGCLPRQATSVTLTLTPRAHGGSTNVSMDLYRMDSAWDATTGWTAAPTKTHWGSTLPAPVVGAPYSLDVTNLFNGWQAGTFPNYGIALVPTSTANTLNDFYSPSRRTPSLRPTLTVAYNQDSGEPFRPCFPLEGTTPYKNQVNTLLDHSNQKGSFYTRDGVILAYDGTTARKDCGIVHLPGFKRILGYVRCDGGAGIARMNYRQGYPAPADGTNVLWYDGHSGYDYQVVKLAPILAATDGILCVSTNVHDQSSSVWSNSDKCPYEDDLNVNGLHGASSSWEGWHIFYIVHPSGRSTWYLHADSLDPAVMSAIQDHGYAEVVRLQQVAFVGGWGGVSPHLHFEVRDGIETANVLDPYGDGSVQSIMWGADPSP
jgi:prepilin-type processing-associated H-X9-DG protein